MKILKNGTVEKTKFDLAVENLVELCGFDKSESGSEAFLAMLEEAVQAVDYRIYLSHKDGLCWDATHDLAFELEEQSELHTCVCNDCKTKQETALNLKAVN